MCMECAGFYVEFVREELTAGGIDSRFWPRDANGILMEEEAVGADDIPPTWIESDGTRVWDSEFITPFTQATIERITIERYGTLVDIAYLDDA